MIGVRTSLLIATLVALSTSNASARVLRSDPGQPDSVYIASGQTRYPLQGMITVSLSNDEPIAALEVTFCLRSSVATFDSVNFLGSRLKSYNVRCLELSAAVLTVYSLPPSGDLIPPGSGHLCRLFVSYPPGTPLQSITIDTTTYTKNLVEHSTYFTDTALESFRPQVLPGRLDIVATCCTGKRGNIDGSANEETDISDITALIDFLYLSMNHTPACAEEADLDSPPDRSIDISDLSILIDYLYIHPTTTTLPDCP
jgi:hypothetical protein